MTLTNVSVAIIRISEQWLIALMPTIHYQEVQQGVNVI